MSGGQAGAENGQLTVMCGGEQAPFDKAKPVADAYAKAITLIGPPGSGQITKMMNQMCIAGLVQGLAEALNLGQRAGLDMDKVIAAISKGAAQSWQMDNRWQTMVDGKFDFGFAVDWMRKDLGIAMAEGKRARRAMPLVALVDQFYERVQERGGGRWDTSSLIQPLQKPMSSDGTTSSGAAPAGARPSSRRSSTGTGCPSPSSRSTTCFKHARRRAKLEEGQSAGPGADAGDARRQRHERECGDHAAARRHHRPRTRWCRRPRRKERGKFLRWLVFIVANIYPTFTYADDPSRFVSVSAARDPFRAATDAYALAAVAQIESEARQPVVPGRALLRSRHLHRHHDALAAQARLVRERDAAPASPSPGAPTRCPSSRGVEAQLPDG